MAGTDQRPADWPITATTGDTLIATDFTLERDGTPWEVDEAVAQVRVARSRTSDEVIELTASVSGAVVSVGPDSLEGIDPGVYYWDAQVIDGTDVLTVVGGTFQVLADVSHEEGS
jgi:hypothetical protein